MSSTFSRSQLTWLMYLMLAFFGYILNILGPITPFLMDEFKLSYTLSSLHFTAFASGLIIAGLVGHLIINKTGRRRAIWMSAFSMSLGTILFISGQTPVVTIFSCFMMGITGSLIPILVSSILSDYYGAQRSVALAEANFFASGSAAIAPLLVGWFSRTQQGLILTGWRLALVIVVFVPILMWLSNRKISMPEKIIGDDRSGDGNPSKESSLPARYWLFWTAIVLAVSIEFCMIFWSADYLEKILGFSKADAALFVSLFLGGMILGRLLGSRLIQHVSEKIGIFFSLAITLLGFLLFWSAANLLVSVSGLFLTGLGIANLYPFILSLAFEVAGNRAVQASARASLASGVAILCLPLILGRLADSVGIRLAYGVIIILLAGLAVFVTLIKQPEAKA